MSEDRFENFPTFSDFFRRLPMISEDFQNNSKMLESYFKHFATNSQNFLKISEDIRRFPMTSEDFIKKILNAGRLSWALCDIFRFFPKIFEDFRRLPKISEDLRRFQKVSETCRNVCFCTLRFFFLSYPKNFQTFNKGDTNPYFR